MRFQTDRVQKCLHQSRMARGIILLDGPHNDVSSQLLCNEDKRNQLQENGAALFIKIMPRTSLITSLQENHDFTTTEVVNINNKSLQKIFFAATIVVRGSFHVMVLQKKTATTLVSVINPPFATTM